MALRDVDPLPTSNYRISICICDAPPCLAAGWSASLLCATSRLCEGLRGHAKLRLETQLLKHVFRRIGNDRLVLTNWAVSHERITG
jgi:hypothetical protein